MTKYLAGAAVLFALMVAPLGLAVDSPSTAVADLADAASPGTSTASGRCSTSTAKVLVERHRLDAFLVPNPIGQLLCGAFAGAGSEALAVTMPDVSVSP